MLKGIYNGITAYGRSFSLLSKLKLWRYFAVPIVISLVTAALIFLISWGLGDNIGALISRLWIWEWGHSTFQLISNFFGIMVVIVIGLFLYRHIVMALSSPFMSPVSEKIERHLYGQNIVSPNSSWISQLIRGIRINIRNLALELLLTIPILLFGFVPVIGVISVVVLFLVQSYYAGFGSMDYTLERHFNYRNSILFVRQNKGLAIGNGMVFMLVLLIPIVGIILVLPLSVTAASTETLKILNSTNKV